MTHSLIFSVSCDHWTIFN